MSVATHMRPALISVFVAAALTLSTPLSAGSRHTSGHHGGHGHRSHAHHDDHAYRRYSHDGDYGYRDHHAHHRGRHEAHYLFRGITGYLLGGYGYSPRYRGNSCHSVSKIGYDDGREAKIGGTRCYDEYGESYIVPGSRYVIHYY